MTAFSRATGYEVQHWTLLRVPTYDGRFIWPRTVVAELQSRGWRWGLVDPKNPDEIWHAGNEDARKKGRWVMRLFESRSDDPAVQFAERLQYDRTGRRLYELRSKNIPRR